MKKNIKMIFLIVGVLLLVIILDTVQALIFNNNPVIGIETKCMKKEGIFVETYHCDNRNVTRLKKSNVCYYEDVCRINVISDYLEGVSDSVKVLINGKEYTLVLEENETVKSFIDLLPKELNMSELNGNEKYVYLDSILPTDSYNPKHIEAGDVMLYGDNCLVIFYKSFDTNYSYTRIGHIDNLPDLGNESINIKIER